MESVHYYRIGADIELYLKPPQLRVEGQFVPLHPQYYAVLLCLVQHKLGIKGKQSEVHHSDLLDAASISVESEGTDDWLRTVIKRLRHVLRDDGKKQSIIKTHRNYGFELLLDVKSVQEPDLESAPSWLLPNITAGKTNLTNPQWGKREQHTVVEFLAQTGLDRLARVDASRALPARLTGHLPYAVPHDGLFPPIRRATCTPTAMAQKVAWGVPHGRGAGIIIDDRSFIPWERLKPEIDRWLLPQVQTATGLNLPVGSRAEVASPPGKPPGWFVELRSPEPDNVKLGHMWFGKDPDRGWIEDGSVRVGDAAGSRSPGHSIVWQTYTRYSDGTYRRIETPRRSTPQP